MKKPFLVLATTLPLATPIFFWILFWQHSSPIVMGDEFRFAQQAFTLKPGEVTFGNYVGHLLINFAASVSSDWYSATKLINAFLATLLGVPTYFIYRKFAPVYLAALGAVVSVLFPIQIYAATALPEIPYYLFLVSSLAFLAYSKDNPKLVLLAGLFAGLAALTKPHAFVFIAVVSVGLILWPILSEENNWRSRTGFPLAFFLSSMISRFGGGVILFGQGSLSPFGSYSTVFAVGTEKFVAMGEETSMAALVDSGKYFSDFFWNQAPGYFASFAHVYLIPLALLLVAAFDSNKIKDADSALPSSIWKITGILVVAYAGLAWVFSALVTQQGDDHSERILFRYVDFLFPILFLLSIFVAHKKKTWDSISKLTIWLSIVLSGLAGIVLSTFGLKFNPADSTTLSLFFANPMPWIITAMLFAFLLIRPNLSWDRSVIGFALGSVTICSLLLVSDVGRFFNIDLEYLRSDSELGLENTLDSRILFVSASQFQGTSAMFNTESFTSDFLLAAPYSQIDLNALGKKYDRIVVVGPPESASLNSEALQMGSGISVFSGQPEARRGLELGYETDDVGVIHEWGYWINGSKLTAEFSEEFLPGDTVVISIRIHPLFDGREIQLSVGGETQKFSLQDSLEVQTLEIEIQEETKGVIILDALRFVDLSSQYFIGKYSKFSFGVVELSKR